MSCARNEIVKQAQAWVGLNEYDGSFKTIIDLYNSHKPLARGYALKYTDAWCAGTIGALAVACKATDIIPMEVSCPKMIEIAQSMGIWVEADDYTPKPADIIMYDWYDSGYGDNQGDADHVGVVEKVTGNTITVIEGNYSNAVQRRSVSVNGRYIRGYIAPEYEEETETGNVEPVAPTAPADLLPMLRWGDNGNTVKAMQILLIGYGYNCGGYGADGEFGDGTYASVKDFQIIHGLEVDGICGPNTWSCLLGIK